MELRSPELQIGAPSWPEPFLLFLFCFSTLFFFFLSTNCKESSFWNFSFRSKNFWHSIFLICLYRSFVYFFPRRFFVIKLDLGLFSYLYLFLWPPSGILIRPKTSRWLFFEDWNEVELSVLKILGDGLMVFIRVLLFLLYVCFMFYLPKFF